MNLPRLLQKHKDDRFIRLPPSITLQTYEYAPASRSPNTMLIMSPDRVHSAIRSHRVHESVPRLHSHHHIHTSKAGGPAPYHDAPAQRIEEI
jgi:hypothetical protein